MNKIGDGGGNIGGSYGKGGGVEEVMANEEGRRKREKNRIKSTLLTR